MRLGEKSIHKVKVHHLNLIIINSIEYSRCARRKSVWPNFSNFNTDCHSGSSSKLSQFAKNVYKQYQLAGVRSGELSWLEFSDSTEPAECWRQYWACHSHFKTETSVNGWILEKTVKNGLTLDRLHIVSIQDNWL